MRFKYTLPVITFLYIVCSARAKKLCDVRIWYLNIITDDVFNLDLRQEQLSLKNSIESMVLKASESKETRMVDCSVLYMYNDMLQELFSYTPSGSGMSLTEVETEEPPQSTDDAVPDLKSDDSVMEEKIYETEYEKDAQEKTEMSENIDNSVQSIVETDEISQNIIESENERSLKNADDTEIKQTETESKPEKQLAETLDDKRDVINTDTETIQDLTATNTVQLPNSINDISDSEETVFKGDRDHTDMHFQTEGIDNLFTGIAHEHFENIPENIDETEVLEDTESRLILSSGISEEAMAPKQIVEVIQSDSNNKRIEPIDLEDVFVSNSIPFGVCWSFGCLMSDIFDVYSSGMDGNSNEREYKNEPVLDSTNKNRNRNNYKLRCPLGPFCTLKCFYIFLLSNSFCMKDSANNSSLHVEEKEELNMQRTVLYENENTEATSEIQDSTENIHKTSDTVASVTVVSKDTNTPTEVTDLNAEERIFKSKEKQNTFTSAEENFDRISTFNDRSKWTVTEFENIVEQKTSKYYSKLQTMEVMIMKLENQLLTEALNKQNHSSTITKLENQILRLENELLKMSKNYQSLREESISMSKRQNKYLELAYKNARNEYPKLSDNSNVKYELISQHQAKINELKEVLKNQSGIIIQLKEKHDTIEEQNRMLQQMLMNQTLLMSSIMKNVQDLTEQNIKNQEEINNLKRKLEKSIAEENKIKDESKQGVIDQLDSLLFNNGLQNTGSDHNTGETENEEINIYNAEQTIDHYMNSYYEDHNTCTIIAKWCPKDNKTCPSCHYTSIINSQCIPFQNIIWSKCKTEQKVTENDFPSVPIVKDEQADNKNDSESPGLENIDNLEQDVSYRQVNQETSDRQHNSIPEDDKSTATNDQVNVNEENLESFYENDQVFNKYTIVGYDRDGKPVFKIRDDVGKQKLLETKEETTNSLKLENENEVNEKDEQKKDNLLSAKNGNMIKTEELIEAQIKSEDYNLKVAKEETKEVLEMQIKVSKNPVEVSKNNTNSGKADEAHNTGSDQDSTFQSKDVKQRNIIDADTGKDSDKPDKVSVIADSTPEYSSDNNATDTAVGKETSVNQKDDFSSKVNNDLSETKNDLKIASGKEKLLATPGQQQASVNNAKVENKVAQKVEQKATNTENKQKERKIPTNLNKYKQTEPKDCYDHYNKGERKDGLFKVKPLGSDKVIEVFCDMRRGGWTVIQRRQDGTLSFFQEWDDYKRGFGGLYGEHWLGNDYIHLLTNQDYYKLRVDLMDWDKNKKYAEFDNFLVENEDEAYRIHIDGYSGDAGDGLTKHDGNKFSTKDVDNDKVVKEFGGSCATRFYGAGWYYKCYASNLNGRFYKGGKIPEKRFDGVTWKPWTGPNYSLKKVEMKIRPTSAKS